MVDLFLEIAITGDTEQKLQRLSALLNPEPVAAWMGETVDGYLHERASQRFDEEGDDASGKWAALKESTQTIRASMQFPPAHPINVRTGELADFIENTPGRVVPDTQGVTLTLPGKEPGNPILQDKLRRAQKGDIRTPARPVLAVNEHDALAIMTEFEYYLRAGMAF